MFWVVVVQEGGDNLDTIYRPIYLGGSPGGGNSDAHIQAKLTNSKYFWVVVVVVVGGGGIWMLSSPKQIHNNRDV